MSLIFHDLPGTLKLTAKAPDNEWLEYEFFPFWGPANFSFGHHFSSFFFVWKDMTTPLKTNMEPLKNIYLYIHIYFFYVPDK